MSTFSLLSEPLDESFDFETLVVLFAADFDFDTEETSMLCFLFRCVAKFVMLPDLHKISLKHNSHVGVSIPA